MNNSKINCDHSTNLIYALNIPYKLGGREGEKFGCGGVVDSRGRACGRGAPEAVLKVSKTKVGRCITGLSTTWPGRGSIRIWI